MENHTENSEELNREQRTKQAQKLFTAGQAKFEKGDLIGAEKFLQKAVKLHPTPDAKKLLIKIQKTKATKSSETDATGTNNSKQSKEESKENLEPSTSSSSSSSERQGRRRRTSSHRSAELDYTKEQLNVVRRVFKAQNYYAIFSVNPDASSAEIKDSYKKLALLVHPDKNKAPGANAAFQAIGNAKDVLTNPTKRKEYDIQIQQEIYNKIGSMPDFNFDIPTWLIVGGVTIVAAGLFGAWWSNRQKKKSREDEEMSQDEEMSHED